MMLMPANHSSPILHYWCGAFPGRIGWLVGPSAKEKSKLRAWVPFALDNDAFTAWQSGAPWDAEAWASLLTWAKRSGKTPLWVLVPDVVADRIATIQNWKRYAPDAAKFGWPLAFAVQDGMTPGDVPESAQVVFVGGTTDWKWRNLKTWTENFPRVHVGRVNEIRRVWTCEDLGVESVDGSGWFRDSNEGRRIQLIEMWLNGQRNDTPNLL